MTLELLHRDILIEIDKLSLSSYPSFLKEEIDYWINQAIKIFEKTRYSGFNIKQKGFQQDQKRTDDLRTLVKSAVYYKLPSDPQEIDPLKKYISTTGVENIIEYPVDYMVSLGETVWITSDKKCWQKDLFGKPVEKRTDVIEATIENLDKKLSNSLSDHKYNSLGIVKPIRVQSDNKIILYTDGNYSVDRYELKYLINPPEVHWDFETLSNNKVELTIMPEHTWNEIISLAVSLMLENISEYRYQTHAQLTQSIE